MFLHRQQRGPIALSQAVAVPIGGDARNRRLFQGRWNRKIWLTNTEVDGVLQLGPAFEGFPNAREIERLGAGRKVKRTGRWIHNWHPDQSLAGRQAHEGQKKTAPSHGAVEICTSQEG